MNKELIEKLKKPQLAQAFCLRSEDEQAALTKAGPANCMFLSGSEQWTASMNSGSFGPTETYILKPGYEPTPEYIEIEIVVQGHDVRLDRSEPGYEGHTDLNDAAVNKDFVCFHDPFGMETTNAGDVPGWMRIVAAQHGDIKMHARFEKP